MINQMTMLLGVAAFVAVAAITPGPNNLAVMNAAAREGVVGAARTIAGIVLGSLALLMIVAVGAGAALQRSPALARLLAISGSLYLCFLGFRLMKQGMPVESIDHEVAAQPAIRFDTLGLFGFQFVNPKGWTMVITAYSTAHSTTAGLPTLAYVALVLVAVTSLGLLIWACFGSLLSAHLHRTAFRIGFNRLMGGALVVPAVCLLLDWSRI